MANHFQMEREAAQAGAWDEQPMLSADVDPQVCFSRADRPQPFHLICEHDSVLAVHSGSGRVEFPIGPARYHTLEPGDFVYVPGGMPHRIVPDTPCVTLRFKAAGHALEGVAWFCEGCGREVHREEWDTAEESAQHGYLRATTAFNDSEPQRTCTCGAVHPRVDTEGNRWAEIGA